MYYNNHKIFLLYLLVLLSTFSLLGQDTIPKDLQLCQNLLQKGYDSKNTGKYTKALEYFSEAEILAESGEWQQELFDSKNNIGVVYVNLSNYEEARGYYQQALEIAQQNPKDNLFMVLNNIANTYSYEGDYQNALKYFKSAYNNPKAVNTDFGKMVMAINIADTYNKLGNFKEARAYLKAVEKLDRIKKTDLFWRVNYAETLYIEGNLNAAEQMMLQLLKDSGSTKDVDGYLYITELLSKIYAAKNDQKQAVYYAKKGLQYTYKPKGRIDLYNRLSDLYFKQKDFAIAAAYKDSVIVTKDSVAALFNKELFETNKIKLKIQRYQNELKINTEKQRAERTLFAIVTLFSLLLFFFIYRVLKNRLLKQRQEKIIAENQQKIIELELDHLQNSIAEKNRKLSAKALYLSGRNELIEEVINSVSKIKEVSQNEEVTNYIKSLKSYLKADTEWDDFITYFEMVNPAFLSTLTNMHPQLNTADIRFICYLYMNLDLKEISNIFSITVEAAKKRKQRIAKKMEVEADALNSYILKITN